MIYLLKTSERDRQVYVSEEMYSVIVDKCVMYRLAMGGADKRGKRTGSIENGTKGDDICGYYRGQTYCFCAKRD